MIPRRHLFTNVYNLIHCMCSNYSPYFVAIQLYNRTDLTLELNILILVFSLICFDFQILVRMRKAGFVHSHAGPGVAPPSVFCGHTQCIEC